MGLENTPPASPGVGGLDDDDQIYDDEIAEEIDVGEGVMEFRMIWRKKTRKKSWLSCQGEWTSWKLS